MGNDVGFVTPEDSVVLQRASHTSDSTLATQSSAPQQLTTSSHLATATPLDVTRVRQNLLQRHQHRVEELHRKQEAAQRLARNHTLASCPSGKSLRDNERCAV